MSSSSIASEVNTETANGSTASSEDSTIKSIFYQCQKTSKYDNFVSALEKIYKKTKHIQFFKEFRKVMVCAFVHTGVELPVNRIFNIVTKFILRLDRTSDSKNDEEQPLHPFIYDMYLFLLEMHEASHFTVRQRSLHLMGKIFKELNELPGDDDLWEKLYESSADRLKDTSANVRREAVLTFCYLQDPSKPECPIIKDFIFSLSHDPCYLVRQSIASTIAVTKKTLVSLKDRLRDVNSAVRKTALFRISHRVSVNCFSITQRTEILKTCLNDLSEDVIKVLKEDLIPAWLNTCDNNVVKLIDLLDIEVSREIIEKLLNIIFEAGNVGEFVALLNLDPESHLIPIENLTEAEAVFWPCLCRYIKNMGDTSFSEYFDDVTPTIVDLCDYLERYLKILENMDYGIEKMKALFIFQQLLILASELDFNDIFGQKRLKEVVIKILRSQTCEQEMVKPLMICWKSMETDNMIFITEIVELIREISREFLTVEGIEDDDNFNVICKALSIFIETMKVMKIRQLLSELGEIKDMVVLSVIRHSNLKICELAIEALGIYCIFNLEEAKLNYGRFMEAIVRGSVKIQITAVKAAYDILMVHGTKLIEDLETTNGHDENDGEKIGPIEAENQLAQFVEKFTLPMLNSKCKEVVNVVVQGVARVMIFQKIASSALFTKLCVLRYSLSDDDIIDENDIMLKYCIAAFISEYSESKALTGECIEETFINVLDNVFDAPASSPLANVDAVALEITLLQLSLMMNDNEEKGNAVHDKLALKLCQKILEDPSAKSVQSLLTIFPHFSIGNVSDDFFETVKKLQKKVKNKRSFRTINKFFKKVDKVRMLQGEEIFLAPMQLSFSRKSFENTRNEADTESDEDTSSELSIIEESDDSVNNENPSLASSETTTDLLNSVEINSTQGSLPETSFQMQDQIVIPESPENRTREISAEEAVTSSISNMSININLEK